MEEIITRLENLRDDCSNLAQRMKKELFNLVNSTVGGKINCDKEDCDWIFGITYDESEEQYREFRIVEVFTRGVNLYVKGYFMIPRSLTQDREEQLEFAITGGLTYDIPTLYALCEYLPQYLVVE